MNGALVFYPTATDQPHTSTTLRSGHLRLDDSPWAPSLLIDLDDQEYLRRLAKVATELADRMDAGQMRATS